MYRVSPELVEQYFVQNFRRGAILRFSMECDDPQRDLRDKFAVLLNRDDIVEPMCFLALATSRVEKFSGRFDGDILRIDPGRYAWFIRPTIISLRELRSEPKDKLKA